MIMSLPDVLHEIVNVAAGHGGRPDLHEAIDSLSGPVDDGAQVQEPVQEQVQEDDGAEADA